MAQHKRSVAEESLRRAAEAAKAWAAEREARGERASERRREEGSE